MKFKFLKLIMKEEVDESVVTRTAAEETLNEDIDVDIENFKPQKVYLFNKSILADLKELVKDESDGDYIIVDFYKKDGDSYKPVEAEQDIEIFTKGSADNFISNLKSYSESITEESLNEATNQDIENARQDSVNKGLNSEEPAPRRLTKAEWDKEFGPGADPDVINAGREPEDRVELINEGSIIADENFIKGLIDSGAIDDKNELNSDEEYNDAVNYWIKHYFDDASKEEIKDAIENKNAYLAEDSYITINDGGQDPDYLVQDVTELEDAEDDTVEAPSVEGLLSLVNEGLSNKYGSEWGYIKSKSISMKENLQYAIIDIVTPSVLREAKENKIKDKAVSKTIILEKVGDSKSLVNLKVNTLAGTTRFSQKTREPAKVLTRWLESEYLYDEMVKDFQDKLAARQATLKDSTESYLKHHPDLKVRIDVIKAQEKMLKDAGMLEDSMDDLARTAYGIAAEFPANTNVEGNKDNEYSMEFDTIDEIVKILFGESYVRDIPKEEKELAKKNKKVLKDNLKEGYENFKIGEIEGTFNTSTGEAMYSIPSKNVTDKKISLEKIPSTDTPYDTDTIIKNYIETQYGVLNRDTEVDDKEVLNEPADTEKEPIEKSTDVQTAEESEKPDENLVDISDELNEDAQSETGTTSFYKIRQREPVSIEDLNEKISNGVGSQESEYIVVKEINLSPEEMKNLTSDLSKPQGFLQDIESIDRKNYPFNVVKITSESGPTLLVDPVGYNYCRYVGII